MLGCASLGQAHATPGVLDIGNGAPSETLDPHRSIGTHDARIVQELFEGLVSTAADGSVGPGAAERWTTSPDGLIWTFHLHPKGRWSDGSVVTAEDFIFGLRRALDPATRAADPRDLYAIKGAEAVATGKAAPATLAVRAMDAGTLEIRLERPTADFLIQISSRTAFPVHRASVAKEGEGFTRPGALIGNGRMVLTENVPQSHVRLVPNPHHRDAGTVTLKAIVFHQTEDATTALKRFRGGELDVSYSSPAGQVEWMRQNLGAEFRVHPTYRTFYLTPNFTAEPWKSSPDLRRALMLGIDRAVLAEKVTRGIDRPAWSLVPPGTGGYTPPRPDWADWPHARRVEEAKRLLAAAGYGPGAKPLEVELLYATDETRKQIAVAVAAMWQQALGVKVVLTNNEARVVWDKLRDRSFKSMVYDSWIDRLPFRFLDLMLSTEGQNNGGFADPAYDQMLAVAQATGDRAQFHDRMRMAEGYLLDRAAVIPVLVAGGRALVSSKVQGWQDSPIQMTPLSLLSVQE